MLSSRLKELRSREGLIQKDVAAIAKVDRGTYANWELGNYKPDIDTIVTLANYYGVSLDYICGLSDISDNIYKDKELCKYINKCVAIYDEFFKDQDK